MAPSDEELGRRQSVYPDDGRRSSQYPEEVPSTFMENSEKLMQFRLLVGSESWITRDLTWAIRF